MKARLIFLALSAVIVLGAFALFDGKAGDVEAPGPVKIAVATDLHYITPQLTDNGEYFTRMVTDADGKVMLYIDELVQAFAAQIVDEKPAALILSGDLTFNGETLSHEALSDILAEVEAGGVPVYVIPGNHDMNSSIAARLSGDEYELVDSPDEGEFREIYADFGYDKALARDEKSLSYVARIAPGLRVVMLDVNTRTDPGYVLDGTLDWLEEQLAEAQRAGDKVIAVSHQNIYAHNPMLTMGYIIGNGGILHSMYTEYGVLCNLAGHIHLQHTMNEGGLPEIVTSSLAVNPNQYGVLTVDGADCEYRTETVDVSGWAEENGITDENLLNFAEYSEGFFVDTALQQAYDTLSDAPNADELANFYADVNTKYFAGRSDLIEWDDALVDAWDGYGYFMSSYFESMRMDGAVDHTHMSWQAVEK